jgi:hypothetical protein
MIQYTLPRERDIDLIVRYAGGFMSATILYASSFSLFFIGRIKRYSNFVRPFVIILFLLGSYEVYNGFIEGGLSHSTYDAYVHSIYNLLISTIIALVCYIIVIYYSSYGKKHLFARNK